MKHLEKNFQQAKRHDRKGQKALYEMFSAKMLAIANSYVNNIHDAEDIVMNSFFCLFFEDRRMQGMEKLSVLAEKNCS